MKKFIVIQITIDTKAFDTVDIGHILRIVCADTKESAIGKFAIETQDIKRIQKLDVNCYELDDVQELK